jgi:hypothetical protein
MSPGEKANEDPKFSSTQYSFTTSDIKNVISDKIRANGWIVKKLEVTVTNNKTGLKKRMNSPVSAVETKIAIQVKFKGGPDDVIFAPNENGEWSWVEQS